MGKGLWRCGLWGWLLAGWVGFASAQDLQTYTQEAVELVKAGRKLANQRKFKPALIKYLAALSLMKQANRLTRTKAEKEGLRQKRIKLLYFIGRTYHVAKQFLQARNAYRKCLAADPSPKVARRVKQYLAQVIPKVQATLVIESTPTKATIRLDDARGGSRSGKTPFLATLEPGTFQLTISHPGYQTYKETVVLQPNARSEKKYTLQRAHPPKQIAPRKRPGQRRPRIAHKRPLQRSPGPSGVLRRPGPPPQQKLARTLAWSGVGLAVVAVGAGILLVTLAQDGFAWVEKNKGNPALTTEEVAARSDGAAALQIGGIVSFTVAGLAVGSSLGLFLWNREKKTSSR
jgi:hypothetical protein